MQPKQFAAYAVSATMIGASLVVATFMLTGRGSVEADTVESGDSPTSFETEPVDPVVAPSRPSPAPETGRYDDEDDDHYDDDDDDYEDDDDHYEDDDDHYEDDDDHYEDEGDDDDAL